LGRSTPLVAAAGVLSAVLLVLVVAIVVLLLLRGEDEPVAVLAPSSTTTSESTTTSSSTTTTTTVVTTTTLPLFTPTVPPAPAPGSGDRSAEAARWISDTMTACDPITMTAVLSIDGRLIALDTLYRVDVTLEVGGSVWVASYDVDFATQDWPEIIPLDADSASLICR
jgi:hypothetical protein